MGIIYLITSPSGKYPNNKIKYFIDKKIPTEKLYELAVIYLNKFKNSKSAVQRLNVSGESEF